MYKAYPLDYSYDALEPYIDTRSLSINYQKYYLEYLKRLNELVLNPKEPLSTLVQNIENYPFEKRGEILFYAGGVLNHELYFQSMSDKKNQKFVGKLKEKMNETYGNEFEFKKKLKEVSKNLVGNGYTFLVVTKNNTLDIVNMPNEETPYLYGLTPIMAIDLWEHSYFLNYQNRRDEYIEAFFEVIDYEKINQKYEEIISKENK